MFDIGFWELLIIGIVGLLVVGPDRLPALATRAGRFIGSVRLKMRRLSAQVQQEMETEHLKTLVDQRDRELDSLRHEAKEVRSEIDHAARSARHGGMAGPNSHPSDMMEPLDGTSSDHDDAEDGNDSPSEDSSSRGADQTP